MRFLLLLYLYFTLTAHDWLTRRVGSTGSATTLPITNPPVLGKQPSQSRLAAATAIGKWIYAETPGKTGEKQYTAFITSTDVLHFAPPANGGSSVTLMLRHRNGNTTVSLAVSKGQFTSSFQGGTVRIRFDKDPPATYAYSAAANGSTSVIFLDAVEPVVKRLKRARSLSVHIGFYSQGVHLVNFNTSDLQWNH